MLWCFLLAACGGAVKAPKNLPAGFTVSRGDRVAIALSAEWTVTQPRPEDFRALADRYRQSNPILADHIDTMAEQIKGDTLRLAAFHADGVTTMNIAAESVPPFQTTNRQATDTRKGLEEIGYTTLAQDVVTLNGRRMVRLEAEITLNSGAGTPLSMALLQYTFVAGSTAYSISFGTPTFQLEDFRTEFEQIAGTFHTVD